MKKIINNYITSLKASLSDPNLVDNNIWINKIIDAIIACETEENLLEIMRDAIEDINLNYLSYPNKFPENFVMETLKLIQESQTPEPLLSSPNSNIPSGINFLDILPAEINANIISYLDHSHPFMSTCRKARAYQYFAPLDCKTNLMTGAMTLSKDLDTLQPNFVTRSIAFPKKNLIAIVKIDHWKIYNTHELLSKKINPITINSGSVKTIALLNDDTFIVGNESGIALHSLDGNLIADFLLFNKNKECIHSIIPFGKNHFFLALNPGQVAICSIKTKPSKEKVKFNNIEFIQEIKLNTKINVTAQLSNQKILIGGDQGLYVMDLNTQKIVSLGHSGAITAIYQINKSMLAIGVANHDHSQNKYECMIEIIDISNLNQIDFNKYSNDITHYNEPLYRTIKYLKLEREASSASSLLKKDLAYPVCITNINKVKGFLIYSTNIDNNYINEIKAWNIYTPHNLQFTIADASLFNYTAELTKLTKAVEDRDPAFYQITVHLSLKMSERIYKEDKLDLSQCIGNSFIVINNKVLVVDEVGAINLVKFGYKFFPRNELIENLNEFRDNQPNI